MEKWFDSAVIYQVYPKSFRDTNNDGIGDIRGIIEKLDYIKELGANTIWLNPFYVSPQVDNGYDVSNYFAVDTSMGKMSNIEELIKQVHLKEMKIIIDFVMNHTSDQHPWFQDAIKNPHSIYRNYYLWSKGHMRERPNNWGSFFGGSVWEEDPNKSDEYYFHLFDKHMPDLNWKNPEVQRSMTDIAKFWVLKGVDGLRLDAFIHISKADFEQQNLEIGQGKYPISEDFYANRYEVRTYLQSFVSELKQVNPDLYILGEAASATTSLLVDYSVRDHNLCDHVISFRIFTDQIQKVDQMPNEFCPVKLDLTKFKQNMANIESKLDGISLPVLYWSNHDIARVLSRYGNSNDPNSAKSLAIGMYLQRGVPLIYYGEELGMKNAVLSDPSEFNDQKVIELRKQTSLDEETFLKKISMVHKMAARFPMQWTENKIAKSWLKGESLNINVASEEKEQNSILNLYRKMLKVKSRELFTNGTEIILETPEEVFGYKRFFKKEEGIVLSNLGNHTQRVNIQSSKKYSVILSCGKYVVNTGEIVLGPWASVVFEKVGEK
ncbi:alpha-amylase family glycosyl hydrolase [Pediococcus claussenii]|uniref:Alpha amylase, catalytic domain protein n=1 Tax=Pediococcus claussenii (strain ATCC BAA-344 / DSM 14800 / JCM 18046 / KCTC 3811 / LMG 21948 / P06) TaxID=701521 RepID=G8PBD8_PEDCP|nr:alpha-amylase family glycosyl hydrolase [Pediococcus claussenii]AEV95927.1 alpha amylase, catalytic domain protein [Pediococcus claussenii ATCC BAA-344]ANZ69417.1 glucohydrolase [Pediococcus claussenii]ANZ71237.1 glucohydrolase [Pediococcus claussenii]KRN20532.1 hypothetical protein IV79_GL000589 [Pediococcus claussenii]